jgi:thiol:disulfide interchange protein DsbD
MKRLCLAILAILSALPALAQGDGAAPGKPTTEARLIFSQDFLRAGDTVWAGIELKMAPGWHTYWRNGGDAGLPTTITWNLPSGMTAGEIQWPVPDKTVTPAGDTPLYTYGYEDRVVLLVQIKIAMGLRPGPYQFTVDVAWMECKDTCNRYAVSLRGRLNLGGDRRSSSAADAALVEQSLARLPQTNASAQVTARWQNTSPDGPRAVIIDWESGGASPDFFPYEGQGADVQGATEILRSNPGHVLLRKVIRKGTGPWPEYLSGILVAADKSAQPLAVEVNLPLKPPASALSSPSSLIAEMLAAFLAGLILNVMPCVLPVIALKALGFVRQSQETPGRVRLLGWTYGAGVLVSFLLLAGLAIATQRAGGEAGWGDVLRHPRFRIALTALMTLIACNLFGLFEVTLRAGVMGPASDLASRPGLGGSFCNGILATVLATPCTAPFLAGALAFALTQRPVVTLLVFLAIGAGLACPFVLVCSVPRLFKVLPNCHGLSHAGNGALARLRLKPQPGGHADAGVFTGAARAGGVGLRAVRAKGDPPKRPGRRRLPVAGRLGFRLPAASPDENRRAGLESLESPSRRTGAQGRPSSPRGFHRQNLPQLHCQ